MIPQTFLLEIGKKNPFLIDNGRFYQISERETGARDEEILEIGSLKMHAVPSMNLDEMEGIYIENHEKEINKFKEEYIHSVIHNSNLFSKKDLEEFLSKNKTIEYIINEIFPYFLQDTNNIDDFIKSREKGKSKKDETTIDTIIQNVINGESEKIEDIAIIKKKLIDDINNGEDQFRKDEKNDLSEKYEVDRDYEDFRVGDKVIGIGQYNGIEIDGTKGEVIEIEGGKIGVRWKKDIGGHNCGGKCEKGYGWYVNKENLGLLNPVPIKKSKYGGIELSEEQKEIKKLLSRESPFEDLRESVSGKREIKSYLNRILKKRVLCVLGNIYSLGKEKSKLEGTLEELDRAYRYSLEKKIKLETIDEYEKQLEIISKERAKSNALKKLIQENEFTVGDIGFKKHDNMYYVFIKVPEYALKNPYNDNNYYRFPACRVAVPVKINREGNVEYSGPQVIEGYSHPFTGMSSDKWKGICLGNYHNPGKNNTEKIVNFLSAGKNVLMRGYVRGVHPITSLTDFNRKSVSEDVLKKEGVPVTNVW